MRTFGKAETGGWVLSRALVFGWSGVTAGGDVSPPGRRLPKGDCLRCPQGRAVVLKQ